MDTEAYIYPSLFGDADVFTLETDEGRELRVLYVDGGFQSASYVDDRRFEAPFAYVRAMARALKRGCTDAATDANAASADDAQAEPARALLLGGGTYSLPKHLLLANDNDAEGVTTSAAENATENARSIALDVVEIDPTVVDIARKHFFLDELEAVHGAQGTGLLATHIQDAAAFLASADDAAYQVIVNDCFAGTAIDAPLFSAETLAQVKRCLAPGGLYIVNVVAEDEDGNDDAVEIDRAKHVLEQAFSQVEETAVDDEEFAGSINHLFFARM